MVNPFIKTDKERAAIWEMLVTRDIDAFINSDWSMTGQDFIEEGFVGIDGCRSDDPDRWKLNFPTLAAYKNEWLRQAKVFKETTWLEDARTMLFRVTHLHTIEISGDSALAHKKFTGDLVKSNRERVPTNWQSVYSCRRLGENWKISGFTGYLPLAPNAADDKKARIHVPEGAAQHSTAGPYSPVLIVNPANLVVISGQASIDQDGKIIGNTIEEQGMFTMENCKRQLASAGCSLNDVFKVTVFMKDLADWSRFNAIYKNYFTKPLPARSAVGTGLLGDLLVEVEMWAVKQDL